MIRRVRRGVSPIVAAILLTAIVIVIGVSVFLWASYSFSVFGGGINTFYTLREEQLKENLIIEHINFIDGNNLTIYVRNVGSIDTRIKTVYILNLDNTSQYAIISLGGDGYYLGVGMLGNISITIPNWNWIINNAYKIKVSTLRGTIESTVLVASNISVSNIRNIEYKFYGHTSGETIHIAAYNFSASSWYHIGDVTSTGGGWINITLPSDYQDFISNSSILIRYYTDYDSTGPDTLYIDYQGILITYVEYI